jgi:hypothetical protein
MWTEENRARYDRSRLRYLSDLPDEEWDHHRRDVKCRAQLAQQASRTACVIDSQSVKSGHMGGTRQPTILQPKVEFGVGRLVSDTPIPIGLRRVQG